MALKATTNPLSPRTLTQWRDEFARFLGFQDYTNDLSSGQKTDLDIDINAAHEYIDKRFAHEPWSTREDTISLVDGTATYALNAAVRQVIAIQETNVNSVVRDVRVVTKDDYQRRYGKGSKSDPWNDQADPRYFLDGMDDSEPPQQQWKRSPAPDSTTAGTNNVTVFSRPYFGLLATTGEDSYTHLPANAVEAIRYQLLLRWARRSKNWGDAQQFQQAREDELAASNINDNLPGANEGHIAIEMNDDIMTELDLLS